MIKPNLRDMKKEATAHAIAEAAFALAMERGMNGFVVEDIVQRAGYSRRTFANYYSCKEEAVAMVAEPYHGVDEAIDCLDGMTTASNPVDALHGFTKLQLTTEYFGKMRTLVGLTKAHPTLLPYILIVHYKLQEAAQQVLHQLFPDRSPTYIRLLTSALTGAILPMFDGSMNVLLPGQPAQDDVDAVTFDDYMDVVFGHLRGGF